MKTIMIIEDEENMLKKTKSFLENDDFEVVTASNPRGGISSRLTIDSDWKSRGGKEVFGGIITNNVRYNV